MRETSDNKITTNTLETLLVHSAATRAKQGEPGSTAENHSNNGKGATCKEFRVKYGRNPSPWRELGVGKTDFLVDGNDGLPIAETN
mmetsp:Transcript_8152/g.17577  ORF Transcript_8152/g.17577 Transcript_8152/m.17577 type:complete len:86 (+) Transcript_8152:458-715(+)